MTRKLMVLILTLFQDNYVRMGTLGGALAGFLSTEIMQNDAVTSSFIFAFIGWGVGAYLANYNAEKTQFTKKKKFRVFQGGR